MLTRTHWILRVAMAFPMLCGAYWSAGWARWLLGVGEAGVTVGVVLIAIPAAVLLFGAAMLVFDRTSTWLLVAIVISGIWLVLLEVDLARGIRDWGSLPLALSTAGYSALVALSLLGLRLKRYIAATHSSDSRS